MKMKTSSSNSRSSNPLQRLLLSVVTERYHESLNNLIPEDVYTGRGQTVLNRRHRIKQKTLVERRRLYYQQKVA